MQNGFREMSASAMNSARAGVPAANKSDTIPHRVAPCTGCTSSGRTTHVVGTHR